jgi:hypothetical protein
LRVTKDDPSGLQRGKGAFRVSRMLVGGIHIQGDDAFRMSGKSEAGGSTEMKEEFGKTHDGHFLERTLTVF